MPAMINHTTNAPSANTPSANEPSALAQFLTGRYGRLALTRAAGEADLARRKGDAERSALWAHVTDLLRRALPQTMPNVA
jgi:hypothetical protein